MIMNMKKEQICRLCFNVTEKAFEIKDGVLSEIFDVLLLKINSDVNEHPVMCHNCVELVKKIFNFKAACMYAEISILCPVVDNPESRFHLNNVYKGSQIIETAVDKKFKICRLCMKPLEERNFMSMKLLMKCTAFAVLMPEIDLDIAKDPVICISCKENLEQYFRFVWHCLNAEETKYHKIEGVNDIPNSANEETTKQEDALGEMGNIDSEIVDLLLLIEYIQKPAIRQKADAFDIIGNGLIKTEDLEIKDESVFVDKKSPKTSKTKKIIYKCEHCYFKTNTKKGLQNHSRIHVEAPQVQKYMCLLCPYEAKYSSHLITHMVIHKDDKEIQMHKCTMCNYESKYKKNLKSHMRTHKNTAEVQMYKCLHCTYETKLKDGLRNHMVKHKDPSELEMCRCPICPFETKYKKSLRTHMLKHKDPSELEMCRCTICSFKTKYKRNLRNHMLSHRKRLEGGIYKCTLCIYKTNRKSSFETHLLTHDSTWKGDIYKCTMCGYQTKAKSHFNRHSLVHKELSQIETYKCSACSFETKLKDYLKKHMIVHKDSLEVEIYKCMSCTYETRYKRTIRKHLLVHKK